MELGPGVSRIVRDLIAANTATEFLKSLVHTQLSYLSAVAAALYTIDDEGYLTLQHQYGFSGDSFAPGARVTIWSKSANTEALRENSILVYQSADEYSKDFPELAGLFDFKQLVILPIWARGLPIGSLSLAFNFEFGPIPDRSDDLWIVYQLLGMVLLSPPQWLYSLSHEVGMSPQNSHELSQHLVLTDSETRVLTLIGEGLTNKEISARLNYSVSYVGKVNMTLFQKLGAEKRRDAVRVAIARGILREGDTNPEDG